MKKTYTNGSRFFRGDLKFYEIDRGIQGEHDTDMNPADGPSADYQRSLMALSEYGSAEDIAGLAAYLADPESAYITGAGITIDGGTNI